MTAGVMGVLNTEIEGVEAEARTCRQPCTERFRSNSSIYVCGDPRLGPVQLPTRWPLSGVTATYNRYGGVCPASFLKRWTAHGSFQYPPHNGFLTTADDTPILGNFTLEIGRRIDRFGSESGDIAHPFETPFAHRSLPPSSLNTPLNQNGRPGNVSFNYHLYEVKKRIVVLVGPVAPWFGQAGMGTQFKFSQTIASYLNQGYLQRISN
ncbi:hypothetical protein VP01_1136g1 [Puccinia sorghi]|uniref:TNT domain-containing protein n=1 Tax=Puccinia sorghi TaxID=27349 RepID=A0A0L6VS01_9BASI|nr:hypothetical protein VP01_1136g1 [Puccinia sorghi]